MKQGSRDPDDLRRANGKDERAEFRSMKRYEAEPVSVILHQHLHEEGYPLEMAFGELDRASFALLYVTSHTLFECEEVDKFGVTENRVIARILLDSLE
jgi:hypothetical protein